MSYSSKVKEEIFSNTNLNKKEIMAELSAIFNSKNAIFENKIELRIENSSLAKRVYTFLKKVTTLKIGIKYLVSKRLGEHNVYIIVVFPQKGIKDFIARLEFSYDKIIKSDENTKGYTKGLFLSCGYMKDPVKEYALDFFIDSEEIADLFNDVLLFKRKKVFKTKKRNKTLVYLRNSEDIMDILVLMGAMQQFFQFEETTMIKDLRNKTVREMNWEVANETKALHTGNTQGKMINYIGEKLGLNNLTPVLEEAAFLRLQHPESSLQEIADMIGISKSGVRNRFRRIEAIYNELLEEEKEEIKKLNDTK